MDCGLIARRIVDGWLYGIFSVSVMAHKKWIIAEEPPVEFLTKFSDLPPMVAHLLYHRGLVTQKAIDEFFSSDYGNDIHDPFLFRDMRKAVDRVYAAVDAKEKIIVHGDYDADGVPAAAILHETITALGGTVDVFIPHRETEGYGVSVNTVELLYHDGVRLMITCDCGISNGQAVARANELGMDIIITDHHALPPELPKAFAIIHPKIDGEHYPFKELAGGGVAWKLSAGLVHGRNNDIADPETFLKWQLDCVAISTITDMVPLCGENRTLVKYGLVVLDRTKRKGLQVLYETAGMKHPITTTTVGFGIGPRLNAAGRMNHANTAFELLITNDDQEAQQLAADLDSANKQRQQLVQQIVAEAKDRIETEGLDSKTALVVWSEEWPASLVGLVASKLVDRFARPAFVLTKRDDLWVGSARSTKYFDLMQKLDPLRSTLFLKFGGHPQSAGYTLHEGVTPEQFADTVETISADALHERELVTELKIDASIALRDVNWDVYNLLQKFEPFGVGNGRPLFLADTLTIVSRATMGNNNQHVRFYVEEEGASPSTGSGQERQWKAMAFSMASDLSSMQEGDTVDCVFEIEADTWNGDKKLMLKVVDMKKVSES